MKIQGFVVCGVMALSASSLWADFSYRESTKITGGAVVGAMKVAGVFSKSARQAMDVTATVAVKGNRMIHRTSTHMSLIDLDARTITDVDLEKKQYSVMTFEEMKQALENLSKKMKKDQSAEIKVRAEANATGKSKDINGYSAKEVLMKIAMDMKDEKKNQTATMVFYSDLWIAESIAGYSEFTAFSKRMAEQLNWTPGGNMFMSQPEIVKGMSESMKALSEMKGAPVFQKVVMGPEGIQPPSADGPTPAAQEKQQPKPSLGGALGGALGGKFGGFGRKKSEPPPQEQPQAQQQQQPGSAGSMIEMETQYSNFAATADASLFEVPAGFKQVESEMKKMK